MSIKMKLPMYIGGLVTASLLVSGLISYESSSNALIESSKHELHTSAERTASIIDSLQNGEILTGSIMANNKRVKDFVDFSNYGNQQGMKGLESAVDNFLKESFDQTKDHAHMFVINKNGYDVADSHPQFENQSTTYTDRDYYKGAMEGKATVGKMVISKNSGKPVIVIGVPIKADSGEVIGVLANSINAEFFTNYIHNIKVGTTGKAYLVDRDGTILAHPEKEQINTKSERTELMNGVNSVENNDQINVKQFDDPNGIGETSLVSVANIPDSTWVVAVEDGYSDIQAPAKAILFKMLLVMVLGIVISALIGWYISRMITTPLTRLVGNMKEMSEGNLDVAMNEQYKDEFKVLADSFNTMSEKMRMVISHMNQSIGILNQSTNELDASAKLTAQSVNETAITTSEIARAVESQAQDAEGVTQQMTQLGLQIDGINNQTELVKEHTNAIIEHFSRDKQVIENLLKINEQSYQEIEKVAQVTESLDISSQNIGNITKVISDIASQTNLLALNASIEAARAGEYGRGFSVVADEIRKLAEQSAHSVKEIDSIIQETQNYSKANIESIHSMKVISSEQSEFVAQTKESFDEIMNKVTDIANRISTVAVELDNMQRGKDEVISYVQNVSAATEEVSASVEEVSATSEEQSATVQQLAGMVETINNLTQELAKTASIFKA
ncbi:methyl-accepting chemotaxis protein [Aneurinibacillus tyrosinisolvens]|uniref:methyl-accepting chemotaxis protein n=1 Tax=Aneurinibacillus tyrosinisolvens TaxID=1443435 RepID=UPI00063FBCE2|nr:methyl-accepting chemotaxis protein [Aneurinibacillus tyrosinisolvens]